MPFIMNAKNSQEEIHKGAYGALPAALQENHPLSALCLPFQLMILGPLSLLVGNLVAQDQVLFFWLHCSDFPESGPHSVTPDTSLL